MKIGKYINKVILGNGVSVNEIPDDLKKAEVESMSESSIDTFIPELLDRQKKGYIMVITHQQVAASLISALNLNLNNQKISVICNGKIDTSALEQEIKDSSLHSDDGNVYFPEKSCFADLYHSDNSIIIKRKPCKGEKILYTANNEVFGVVLDAHYKYEYIRGTVERNIHEMCIQEKARLFLELTKNKENSVSSFSDILILANGDKHYFVSLPNKSEKDVYETYLRLFSSISNDSGIGEAIIEMSKSEAVTPAVVREDINSILTHKFINSNIKLPPVALLKNSMERILISC